MTDCPSVYKLDQIINLFEYLPTLSTILSHHLNFDGATLIKSK